MTNETNKPQSEDEFIAELQLRKQTECQDEYRRANNAHKLLLSLIEHVPHDDLKLFYQAFVNPQKRRLDKAAQALTFWSAGDEVKEWLKRKGGLA